MSDEQLGAFLRGFGRGLAEGMIEAKRECAVEWGEGYHGIGVRLSSHLCSRGDGHGGKHRCYCGAEHELGAHV